MSKPSQVVVLAEDQRHQRFVREYLYRKGFERHQIRMEPLPSGRGCGEQWVRARYTMAVAAYRHRSAKAASALVVAINADTEAVTRRQQQLRDSLTQAQMPERMNNEAIAHFIPKQHIETWLLFLGGRPVDEDTDYHDAAVDGLFGVAANTFAELCRSSRQDVIASLSLAILEVRRIP